MLALGKLTVQAKSGSWGLLALTLLLATLKDASHPWGGADWPPQLGDELREGVESGGTGEAALLPCLSSAPPMRMVIFFCLSHLLFLLA